MIAAVGARSRGSSAAMPRAVAIVAKMEDTSALDGRQEAEDDGLFYS